MENDLINKDNSLESSNPRQPQKKQRKKNFFTIFILVLLGAFIFIFASKECNNIITDKNPIASFTILNNHIYVNDTVCFKNNSLNAKTYQWNFGDGHISIEKSPNHIYNNTGNYKITLAVFYNGQKHDTTVKIQVSYPDTTASFTISDKKIHVNDTVYFKNNSLNAANYLWDFGDGQTSRQKDPKHIYNKAGKYIITLTVYSIEDIKKQETRDSIQVSYQNLTFEVEKDVSFEMLYVEGGTFNMGDASEEDSNAEEDEYPLHKINLLDFYIGKYEVTQELWHAVMGDYPSKHNKGGKYPVESISWNECQEFIEKLNRITGKTFSLPTEAQWEFAAKGGTKSKNHPYNDNNHIDDMAWYGEDIIKGSIHPVGRKQPNELGIYDMTGNVWEWCNDWYDEKYYSVSPDNNPTGAVKGNNHVRRGGSYSSSATNCRTSNRAQSAPDTKLDYVGFRLVLLP